MMNGGHYIAYVKNESNNNWYQYDDSSVKDIPESRVRNPNAYILFYQRKDLTDRNLRDVFPNINTFDP
jgi:ubiquitin C-terminal hydrolase